MEEVRNKILLGSVSQLLDRRKILGNNVRLDSVLLYEILLQNYYYAKSQLEKGSVRYNVALKEIIKKMQQLKYHCPDICLYKVKQDVLRTNTAPQIEDNIITLEYSLDFQNVIRNEVIKNYFDAENDGMSEVFILSKSDELDINVGNQNVILFEEYTDFPQGLDLKLDKTGIDYLIYNTGNPCEGKVVKITDLNTYNQHVVNGFIIQEFSLVNNHIIMQKVDNSSIQRVTVPVAVYDYHPGIQFEVRVKDNNPTPLLSNVATISVRFTEDCEQTPSCGFTDNSVVFIPHENSYTFNSNDFKYDNDIIIITAVENQPGELRYKGQLVSNMLPLVIRESDIANLVFIPEQNVTGEIRTNITFKRIFSNSLNPCDGDNTLEVVKEVALNQAPIANAGPDRNITLSNGATTATITQSGSESDPDNNIVSRLWTIVSGPGNPTILTPTQLTTGFFNMEAGTYVVKLTVTDAGGLTGEDTATIVLNPSLPIPVLNVGSSQDITQPDSDAVLTANVNANGNVINSTVWTQFSGPSTANILSDTTLTTTVNNLSIIGTYTFRMTVTYNTNQTLFADVQVVVNAANQPPTVTAVSPINVTLPFPGGTAINSLGYLANDPDGDTLTAVWSQISGPNTATLNPTTGIVSNLILGTYVFEVVVTDPEGLTASDQATVVVSNPSVLQDISLERDISSIVVTDNTVGNIRTYTVDEDLVLNQTLSGSDSVTATISYDLLGGNPGSIISFYLILNGGTPILVNQVTDANQITGTFNITYTAGDTWTMRKVLIYDTSLTGVDRAELTCYNDALTVPQALVINSGNYTNPLCNISLVTSFARS